MGKGSSDAVIGYWYAVGMHMVVCHGPCDEVTEVLVGDKSAWIGSSGDNTRVYINQPNLFGGEDREGGIQGYVDFMFGGQDQPCNDYLVDRIGGGPPIGDPNQPTLAGGLIINPDGSVTSSDGTPVPGYDFTSGAQLAWQATGLFNIPAIGATSVANISAGSQLPTVNSVVLASNGFSGFVGKVTAVGHVAFTGQPTLTLENQQTLAGSVGDSLGANSVIVAFINPSSGELSAAGPGPYITTKTGSITLGNVGDIVGIRLGNSTSFPTDTFAMISDGISAWIGQVAGQTTGITDFKILNIIQGAPGDVQGTGTVIAFYAYPGGDVVEGNAGQSGFIPAWRGVLSFVLRQTWVSALSAYIKPWAFRVRRAPKALTSGSRSIDLNYSTTYTQFTGLTTADVVAGTDGDTTTTITTDSNGNSVITQVTTNPNGVTITNVTVNGTTTTTAVGVIRAANPAAIIAECFLNTQWGLGFQIGQLDLDSFETAAATLAAEQFGMCLTWSDQTRMEDFINQILKTVNAARYEDPSTGRIGLRLIRDDYDINSLPIFDTSNVVEVSSLVRPDSSDIINQVTINFIDRATGVDRSITAHNGASIDQLGAVNPTTIDYPGIPTMDIARRVVSRELGTYSRGMGGLKLITNPDGAKLKAGDVFKLNWAPLGISGMVLRVSEVDYGLLTDNRVTIQAVEDFFAFPSTSYIGGGNSGWIDPNQTPKSIGKSKVFEIPYYMFQTEVASDLDSSVVVPSGYGFVGAVAARPQSLAIGYSLYEDSSGAFVDKVDEGFTPYATLNQNIDDKATSFACVLNDLTNLKVNSYAFLDDEIVGITGISGNTVTVMRGVMDTVPVAHTGGATLWFAGGNRAVEEVIFLSGQTLNVKLQNRTTAGAESLLGVTAQPITFAGRAERPYPPGNIKIDGVYRPSGAVTLGVITWSARNRLTQTAGLIDQTAGSITAEPGTTYTVVIKQRASTSDPWTVAETATGITANTYTPTGAGMAYMRVEISSVRDGLTSYQTQVLEVTRSGFGINFGNSFGS